MCNISCNYCSRKFDCVNESRPGVTSEVLTPEKALERFQMVKKQLGNLTVVGIAGPGDALANWQKTKKTLELIRQEDPDTTFCLSTNGLLLPELVGELAELNLQHVTVTINSLDPKIGAKIYRRVNDHSRIYTGEEGAELLIARQLQGVKELVNNGVLVKVNIVMMEGINDHGIPEVVRKVKELGAFTTNIMPFIPAEGSRMANHPPTNTHKIMNMRKQCGAYLQQMSHCKQCRADAIGLLGQDCSAKFIEGRQKCSYQKDVG
ncbi:Nitrogenase FeMo-cofactor synthesis FeS core scaffold and assembly protein NifB [Dehalobacter sp. UNSWDHB]|nr:Nitrogenase FeMo-cofactor synthesis FeS core scaffold and assembly protein NifB [Dehalobacter sp. DCA]AFV06014.1 Nitrogenase FeMo-cofactor synthesis FeS core scaffold and assembly protein NifB [Dehalobacter sp. CF]EQB22518.1 Nitrogenase FeMo-cofactor synthesis FeS core scaffold and assembly protein NifB [Dehalobacter sp. UNSWDHB]